MRNILSCHRLPVLLIVLTISTACNSATSIQTSSDYDKLCAIFAETLQKKTSSDMMAYEIATRAEKEVPDILDDFQHVSMANAEDAYPLLKKVAEAKTKKPWDCPTIKAYYDRAYRKKLERNSKQKNINE